MTTPDISLPLPEPGRAGRSGAEASPMRARNGLLARVSGERSALRGRMLAVAVLAGLAIVLAALALLALVLTDGRWMRLPRALPLAGWLLAAFAAAYAMRRWSARETSLTSTASVARLIELEQNLRSGALVGALEVADRGVLGARAAQDVATKLGAGPLAPGAQRRYAHFLLVALALVLLATLAFAAAQSRAPDGVRAALHPIRAWRGTLLPSLSFERLPASVPRGMPVTLGINASGRREVKITWLAEGEASRDTTLVVNDSGRVSLALGPLRAHTIVQVSDGRSLPAAARLVVEDRGWVGDVILRAHYPAYLGRADENLAPVPELRVPRGTRVSVQAGLHSGVESVTLVSNKDSAALSRNGELAGGVVSASTVISIDSDSRWEWIATASPREDGALLPPELPDPLSFVVMPDLVPQAVILSPGADGIIGSSGSIPVMMQANDDHGLNSVHLEVWRETTEGSHRADFERLAIASPESPFFDGGVTLPLDDRGLVAGDRLHLVAVVIDNSPWRQEGRSQEVVVRVPSLTEQRAMARLLADSIADRARQLAQQERRLAQNTEDAARNRELQAGTDKRSDGASNDGEKSSSMSFKATEQAKQLARDQQQLSARVDSLREGARELESRLKDANALDPSLSSQMQEIQKMLREALTPEMQRQLEELNKSTERLSGVDAQKSMQQLAEQQRQMREQLERSAEMLKRAALEGAMQTLGSDAEDLAEAQRNLAEKLEQQAAGRQHANQQNANQQGASQQNANQQAANQQNANQPNANQRNANQETARESREVSTRSRNLEQEIEALAKRLQEAGAREGASKTREAQPMAKQAADAMERASRGSQDASDQARNAARSMEQAAEQLSSARDAQVSEWKDQLSDQLDQAISETMQLSRQQSELEQKARQQGADAAKQLQGEQSALQQGVQRAAERMEEAGRSSSLLSQRSQKAMGDAQRRVQDATRAMQQAQAQPSAADQMQNAMRDASDALNQALSSLVRDRERVNNAQSASGFTEMVEQLKELASQQGELNGQMQGLNLLPGGAQGQQAQQQTRALARQQRAVASDLRDVSDNDVSGRTDALAQEAQSLAQQIERNGLDESVAARQQQLYRRLLDAGRFLEQEERDDQGPRESRAASGNGSTGAVDGPQSGRAALKYAPPTWNDLRGLAPDERRLVVEYFRRLNGGGPPP